MRSARFEEQFDASFFLLRSPLLEYDKAVDLLLGIESSPQSIKERLGIIYKTPLVREAVYLSSPELYSQLIRYFNNELTDKRAVRKIEHSLIQYYVRMCSRCTPFGLLAACSAGKFDTRTDIVFDGVPSLKRFARFDMDSICRMVEALKSDRELRRRINLYPNTSLYCAGGKFRYIEYSLGEDRKSYTMQEVPYSSLLNRLIGVAGAGIGFDDLVLEIVKDGYDREEAIGYVHELIDSQVLITGIEPALTDPAYLSTLIKAGTTSTGAATIAQILEYGAGALCAINQCPDPITIYRELDERAQSLGINIAKEKLIQVDLFRQPVICNVSFQIKQKTLEALNILKGLYGYRIRETRLESFKRAFAEKYEGAAVGICEALDAISGLNFESMSLEDAYRDPSNVVYDKIMQYKLKIYAEGIHNPEGRVSIDRAEVEAIGDNNLPVPDSFSVTLSLFMEGGAERIFIRNAGGASAINMLSRFCHMDQGFADDALKVTTREQDLEPDRIVAEIVHLPESRLGNILIRPKLRAFEIPYMVHGYSPAAERIAVADLYLRMENGRLILFSKTLKKEILPRLTTAHNYTKKSLPVYQLLCELQYQGLQPGFTWHWGFLEGEKFLPRVTYRDMIISLAFWNLDESSLKDLLGIQDDNLLKMRFTRYRQELKIPSLVYLLDYENEFLLNLDNILSIRYLFNFIKKRSTARLQEVIWQSHPSPIEGPNGRYINEVVVPFIRTSAVPLYPKSPVNVVPNAKAIRKFYPGSEWLYFKIYLSAGSIRKMLAIVYKFISKETRRKKIRKWFFVNYTDPKLHIRVRMEMFSNEYAEGLIAGFFSYLDPYLKTGEIHDIVIAPYVRELERYGAASMGVCEEIFSWSSNLVCSRLPVVVSDRESTLFNLRTAFLLLRPNLNSVQHIHDICKSSYTSFATEFHLDLKRSVRDFFIQEYRELSKDICLAFMELAEAPEGKYSFLQRQHQYIGGLITGLYDYKKAHCGDFYDVIRSVIHMHYNRAYTKDQRFEEMKAYCYLAKYFSSQLALAGR